MSKLLAIFLLWGFSASAQDISIQNGWKFKTGDDPSWADPKLSDSSWSPIAVGRLWEDQGYDRYDGFAWYRIHVIIPSGIKDKAFLKEKIRFDLGKIDDGDEVYLNGQLIGRNANMGGRIEEGNYELNRSYSLAIRDPRILWDKENVIAVRVYDHGGGGGMYEGHYGISMMDVTDFIVLNASDHPFQFDKVGHFTKKITLQSTSDQYDFTGKLRITILDPISKTSVLKQTISADFAKDRSFEYQLSANLPEQKSYLLHCSFIEDRTGKEITQTEGIPYILTPKPGDAPRINGPAITGSRPGSPFLYRIPATGLAPIVYEVEGLPAGLHLNKQTGLITGTLNAKGRFKVNLIAKNRLGSSHKAFTISCGELIGLTPALGWNSWNCWGLSVSDEKIRISARQMADKLVGHGWAYINIDDGWQGKRNDSGFMVPNSKFPDMKGLCDYVHSLGLRVGIYSSPGTLTCGRYAGSYMHEKQDADTYANWGIDYLKYDWCSYSEIAPSRPGLEDYQKPYILMHEALQQNKHDILYSLCQYGMGDVWKWGASIGANSWRTTGDITDTWSSMSAIGFNQDQAAPFTAPGHFNDPDMLVVGKVGWGPSLHTTRLSPDEQYTHISLWSLLASPLLIGCDMSQLDDFTLNLLTNDEVLAVNQDALASPARKVLNKDQIQVWTRDLEDGSTAIGIFNLSEQPQSFILSFSDLRLSTKLKMRDLWRQKDLGLFSGTFQTPLPAHGVVLLKAKKSL